MVNRAGIPVHRLQAELWDGVDPILESLLAQSVEEAQNVPLEEAESKA